MPRIDLTNIKESAGGGAFDVEPGGYVAVVIDYDEQQERKYVKFSFDIAEGPSRGIYAKSQWPIGDVMSWKSENALGMTKHKLHVFADSNPGFDTNAAFQTDDWGAFVNRLVGIVVRERIYTKKDGSEGRGVEIAQLVTPDAIRSGDFVVPGPRDARASRGTTAAPNPPAQVAAAPAERMPWD